MSKNKQIIIFSLIGIAVLGAVTAVLMLTAPKAEEEEKAPVVEEEKPVVFETDAALTKLTVTNEKGEFVITAEGESYTIKEIEKAPLLTDSIASAAENAVSMTADQFVEETEDLAKYGLSEPRATVTAEFSDGKVNTFKVGDDVPNTTTKVYLTADDKNVYTYLKSKVSAYLGEKFDFVNTLAVPEYNQQSGEEVNRLTVERADLTEPLVIESIASDDEDVIQVYSYRLVSPYDAYADLKDAPNFMYSLFGLKAKSAQWVGMTEEDYERAGLNNPSCTVTVETTEKTYTLTLGLPVINTVTDEEGNEKKELSGFFGMSSEVPDVLYLFSADDVPASTINPEKLISRLFLMPYIYSLDTVEYSDSEGRSFTFGFETIEGEDTVDENGETVKGEDVHYHYVDGKKTDNVQLLKDMYQYLISASGEELYFEEEKGKLLATVEYTYTDKTEGENGKDIVSFYESESDRKVIINVNGKNQFKTRRMYITQLFANADSFLSGGEIVLTY